MSKSSKAEDLLQSTEAQHEIVSKLADLKVHNEENTGDKKEEKKNFYAVSEGQNNGIFEDWAKAGKQVTGYPGNNHKKFHDRGEAITYIRNYEKELKKKNENVCGSVSYELSIDGVLFKCYANYDEMEPDFINNIPEGSYIRTNVQKSGNLNLKYPQTF